VGGARRRRPPPNNCPSTAKAPGGYGWHNMPTVRVKLPAYGFEFIIRRANRVDALRVICAFTGLFAAISPEEDFVETYKYAALAAAADPAGNRLGLDIAFPARVEHVIDAVRTPSAELGGKIGCVNTLGTP
jgi:hypothetical protein